VEEEESYTWYKSPGLSQAGWRRGDHFFLNPLPAMVSSLKLEIKDYIRTISNPGLVFPIQEFGID